MTALSPTIENDLSADFKLTDEQIKQFQDKGFIKLKQVLSPETIHHFSEVISREVERLNTQKKAMSDRSTYEKAFLQIMNLWTQSDEVKTFAFSKKLARIAAELMGVDGVRMYHDQALYKEPGGGITPWHADQYYWPLDTDNTVTVWIPLQETPKDMGPLQFSSTSQKYAVGRNLEISDDSEKKINKELLDHGLPLVDEPFDLGEVSYHYGWTFHRAGANSTDKPRRVMTVIYIEDGAHLIEPNSKARKDDIERWMPGAKVGEVVDTDLNPVLYKA